MLRRPVHASAGTSVRWHGGPALPTPRSTAHVLRREGTHRRKCQLSALSAGAARAQPSCRARPSDARGAMLPRHSQCPSPRLHTDSCQTPPLSRHAHATSKIAPVPRAVDCARSDPRLPTPSPSYSPSVTRYPHKRHFSSPPQRLVVSVCFPTDCLRRAGATAAFDVMTGPRDPDPTSGRRGGRCRCREASARIGPTGKDVDRCDSRLRHRPDEGWCRTRALRKAA